MRKILPDEYHSVSFVEIVHSWDTTDVVSWLEGLDSSVIPYLELFRAACINGKRLLLLTSADMIDMGIVSMQTAHTIANGIQMLISLCFEMDSENLQSIALQLSAKCRNLIQELRALIVPSNEHDKRLEWEALPNEVLMELSSLAEQTKKIISWLDRSPFNVDGHYLQIRDDILHLVVRIIQIIRSSCRNLGDTSKNIQMLCSQLCSVCDSVVEQSTDPLVLQTAYIEAVVIKRAALTDELGFNIEAPYKGMHVINEVKFRSPADLCNRLTAGDEILQVNGQTVVGWQLNSIVKVLVDCEKLEMPLLLKRRPRGHGSVVKTLLVTNAKLPVVADIPPSLTLRPLKKRRRSNSLSMLRVSFNQLSFVPSENEWVKALAKTGSKFSAMDTNHLRPGDVKRITCSAGELRGEGQMTAGELMGLSDQMHFAENDMQSFRALNNLELGSFVDQYQFYGCHPQLTITNAADECIYAKVERADENSLLREGIVNVDSFSCLDWNTPSNTVNLRNSLSSEERNSANLSLNVAQDMSPMNQNVSFDMDLSSWSFHERHSSAINEDEKDDYSSIMSTSFQSTCTAPLSSNSKAKLRKFFGESFDYPETRWYFDASDRSEIDSVQVLASPKSYGGISLEGWVYQAKSDLNKSHFSLRKWIKRWMVLKGTFLYLYSNPDSCQPELDISLLNCRVSPPGSEMKSRKKNVFQVQNAEMTVYFRVEHHREMLLWLKKLGLAAIGYSDGTSNTC